MWNRPTFIVSIAVIQVSFFFLLFASFISCPWWDYIHSPASNADSILNIIQPLNLKKNKFQRNSSTRGDLHSIWWWWRQTFEFWKFRKLTVCPPGLSEPVPVCSAVSAADTALFWWNGRRAAQICLLAEGQNWTQPAAISFLSFTFLTFPLLLHLFLSVFFSKYWKLLHSWSLIRQTVLRVLLQYVLCIVYLQYS